MYDYLSIDDSRIILNHLFGNKERSVDDRNPVPYAIFTDPPMAHIGLTEEEAMKRGYPIKISRLPTPPPSSCTYFAEYGWDAKSYCKYGYGENTGLLTLLRGCTGTYQSSSICHENRTEIFGFT